MFLRRGWILRVGRICDAEGWMKNRSMPFFGEYLGLCSELFFGSSELDLRSHWTYFQD